MAASVHPFFLSAVRHFYTSIRPYQRALREYCGPEHGAEAILCRRDLSIWAGKSE
jgi:hypothetical protein